ncbi:MAG: DUF11 domain-containing protein [Cocleimonas sp.]
MHFQFLNNKTLFSTLFNKCLINILDEVKQLFDLLNRCFVLSIKTSFFFIVCLFSSSSVHAFNFCQSQPVGGDIAWDIVDNGSTTIPFIFNVGDEATPIEQVNSVTVKGLHQYAGDLAAELIPPTGAADSVILFRLGDGRFGEGASNCNEADFDMIFTDNSTGTDLSVNDQANYCTGTNNRGPEGVWPQPYLPNFPNVGTSPALNGNPKTYESEGIADNFLSNLVGQDPKGAWGIFMEDAYAQDIGTLTEVCIDMDFGSVTYDIWVSKNSLCNDKTDTETFDYGETGYVCYDVSNQATENFTFQSEINNHGETLSADLTGLYENQYTGTTIQRIAYRPFTAGSTFPIGSTTLTGSVTVEGAGAFFAPGETITSSEMATVIVNPPLAADTVDLEITKTVSDTNPNIGDIVTFYLLIENLGPGTATLVSVNDIIPAGFTYVNDSMTGISPVVTGITPDQSSPDSGTGLTWTIGSLSAVPSSTTLTFQATVEAP